MQEKEREIDEDLETASDQLQRSFTTEEAMLRRVPNKCFEIILNDNHENMYSSKLGTSGPMVTNQTISLAYLDTIV